MFRLEHDDAAEIEFARQRAKLRRDHLARHAANQQLPDIPSCGQRHVCLRIIIRVVRISASAPTRIDLAGGTIDIWPLFLFHPGAQTLNAAISLRAHAWIEPRADDRIELVSEDTHRNVLLAASELAADRTLPLLGRLVHRFGVSGLTLTTRGESPAGAGIAGSSAMNDGDLRGSSAVHGQDIAPEALLDIARDVEAQVIHVPTGVQDYRPAMYGGVAAVELGAGFVRRVPLPVDPRRPRTPHRPLLHGRAAQLGHQQLGDHQAAHRRRPARL